MFIFLVALNILNVVEVLSLCPTSGLRPCSCGIAEYPLLSKSKQHYVVNCTNLHFTNVTALSNLPEPTEVLIFVGNNVSELPWNLFGSTRDNSNLRVVDLSNNRIKDIRGKSFHRVPAVERLILNHNDLTISSRGMTDHHHPRVFSNFESLTELHLTNAFADNTPEDLASDLHDIFINSNLTKLKKLHLEQNEISRFKDKKVFCELVSLMDLHLGDNKLKHVNFTFDCLKHLRFIDLQRNEISDFTEADLAAFDSLPARGQPLTVDLSENPLACGPGADRFFDWLQVTNVTVRNKSYMKCTRVKELTGCIALKSAAPTSSAAVTILSALLIVTTALLVYTNRSIVSNRFRPALLAFSRKVQYSNIGRTDAQEMDV